MSENMMRYIIGISFAALALWVLQATGVLMAVIVFLMVGAVPGTSISIPPAYMFLILAGFAALVAFWMARQRPIKQIKELKQAHEEALMTQAITHPTALEEQNKAPRVPHYKHGFHAGFQASHRAVYAARRRFGLTIAYSAIGVYRTVARLLKPVQIIVVVIAITSGVTSREIAKWARPHVVKAATWLKVQASYSLKGTMLSAHKWSSLSKKLLSSVTSLLKRCISALKRGKSFFIRSAR